MVRHLPFGIEAVVRVMLRPRQSEVRRVALEATGSSMQEEASMGLPSNGSRLAAAPSWTVHKRNARTPAVSSHLGSIERGRRQLQALDRQYAITEEHLSLVHAPPLTAQNSRQARPLHRKLRRAEERAIIP